MIHPFKLPFYEAFTADGFNNKSMKRCSCTGLLALSEEHLSGRSGYCSFNGHPSALMYQLTIHHLFMVTAESFASTDGN